MTYQRHRQTRKQKGKVRTGWTVGKITSMIFCMLYIIEFPWYNFCFIVANEDAFNNKWSDHLNHVYIIVLKRYFSSARDEGLHL